MNLTEFDGKYLPFLQPLENSGSLCYFNALVQALLSCTSFNKLILDDNSLMLREFTDIYRNKKRTSVDLLKLVIAITDDLSLGSQEDAHEGFTTVMGLLDEKYKSLFYVRHIGAIYCKKCTYSRELGNPGTITPPELTVSTVSDETKSSEDRIKTSHQYPEDYVCEKCGAKNTKTTNIVIQKSALVRVSDIIAIVFKKYHKKELRVFPQELTFSSKVGTLRYRVVAQIEHYGSMYSGHYVAICLRKKPVGFHKDREEKIKKLIEDCERDGDLENSQRSRELLHENAQLASESMGVFMINDEEIKFSPKGFVPTEDTYMVFYQLNQK